MVIVDDDQYELLSFIQVCNRGGYAPTRDEVTLWQQNPEPREGKYRYEDSPSINAMAQAVSDTYFRSPAFEKLSGTFVRDLGDSVRGEHQVWQGRG